MTPSEFKAWFDGFTEAFGNKVPTKAQWDRVKARVAEIDGKSVTEKIYIDRYWPLYRSWYGPTSTTYSNTVGMNSASCASSQYASMAHGINFDSSKAMNDLGRVEAKSLVSV